MSKIERALERAQSRQASSRSGKSDSDGEKLSILERATETANNLQHDTQSVQQAAGPISASVHQGVSSSTNSTNSAVATGATVAASSAEVVSDGQNSSGKQVRAQVPTDSSGSETPLTSQNMNVVLSSKVAAAQGLYSHASEEYRKLKEQVVKLTNQSGFQNMLMVTSSTMGEGKSVTSVNLAVSLAQEFDHTVLLIDADMRRPTCHTHFGLEGQPGLAECLLDNLPYKDAIVSTGIGRLSFMPAGRVLSNPGELFNSSLMRDFLVEVKNRYPDRYIILDTAPVLPFAETRVLSRIVDGTILVVREGTVAVKDVKQTFQALEGSKILGMVYNGSTKATAPSGYYAYAYAYRR